jgi:diaminopimelate epimerase
MSGRLGYKIPSPMTLLNAPLFAFDGEGLPQGGGSDPVQFKFKVHNDDGKNMAECSNANDCVVKFNRDYTADLLDVTPSNVYKDQLVQFHMNGKSVSKTEATPAAAWPFREIRIGGSLVDWEDSVTIDQRLNSWAHDTFEARVGD